MFLKAPLLRSCIDLLLILEQWYNDDTAVSAYFKGIFVTRFVPNEGPYRITFSPPFHFD